MKKTLSFLCVALLASCSSSNAASDNAKNTVNKLLRGRATIVKEFDATDNLKGFVLAPNGGSGQESIVYADNAGKYLVDGNIISADGTNLSQQNYQKYVTNNVAPKAYQAAAKTHWFLVGKANAPHKAYMIVEPNCSGCHMAYEQVKPMIDSGQLAVRFIMVAFLKPDSQTKAAAILTAKDPGAAFALDEKGFVMSTESGGITPLKTVDAATKAKIQANIEFMQKYHFPATPVVIYKTSTGKYQAQVGFPSNKQAGQAMINSMAGEF